LTFIDDLKWCLWPKLMTLTWLSLRVLTSAIYHGRDKKKRSVARFLAQKKKILTQVYFSKLKRIQKVFIFMDQNRQALPDFQHNNNILNEAYCSQAKYNSKRLFFLQRCLFCLFMSFLSFPLFYAIIISFVKKNAYKDGANFLSWINYHIFPTNPSHPSCLRLYFYIFGLFLLRNAVLKVQPATLFSSLHLHEALNFWQWGGTGRREEKTWIQEDLWLRKKVLKCKAPLNH